MWEGKKGEKTSQKYKKMTKYLYFISGLSQNRPNLPTHDSSFFLHLLWMIVTLAAPTSAPLWSPSCKIKTNPGTNVFSVCTGELSFGKPYGIKPRCYGNILGNAFGNLGTLWEFENSLRTWWEHIGKKEKIPVFPPPPSRSWVHAEPSHWLHETFISKTVHPHFLPRLTAGA
jgi:hypothetical protein